MEFWGTYCEISHAYHFHSQASGLYREPVQTTSVVLIAIATWVDCLLLDIVEDLSAICEQGFSISYPGLWVLNTTGRQDWLFACEILNLGSFLCRLPFSCLQ